MEQKITILKGRTGKNIYLVDKTFAEENNLKTREDIENYLNPRRPGIGGEVFEIKFDKDWYKGGNDENL